MDTDQSPKVKLFVYGTLKRGFRANGMLQKVGANFIGEALTKACYRMYNCGWYPCIVHDAEKGYVVKGEIWEVPQSCIPMLDAYEGAPVLYKRVSLEIQDNDDVIGYVANEPRLIDPNKEIDCGEWRLVEKKS